MTLKDKEQLFTNAYACQLIWTFQEIRELVQEHDENVIKLREKQRNFTSARDKKFLVKFKSTHLIGFWTDDEKPHEYDHLESTYLTYPITLHMILEFVRLNRHLMKCDENDDLSLNYDKVDKISDDDDDKDDDDNKDDDGASNEEEDYDSSVYRPLPIEDIIANIIKDDVSFYELDDRFYNSELIYGILINKTKKIIKIVFRASKTNTDWIKNLKFNKITTKFVQSFASRKTRLHSGFAEYLFDSKGTVDRETSKFEEIVAVLEEIRSKKDLEGNELFKDYNVVTTGHSLGGALAQLLGFALAGSNPIEGLPLPINVITFGTPGVGNTGFVKTFKALEQRNAVRHIRISVDGDFFPVLPYVFTPQCGVNINLIQDRKAKVKYSNDYNIVSRTSKGFFRVIFKRNETMENHSIDKHLEHLKHDVNKAIATSTIEEIYNLSGALYRFQRLSFMSSIVMTKEQRLRGSLLICCCSPKAMKEQNIFS